MGRQEALVANLDLCMGCLACEVACKQEHSLAEGEKRMCVIRIGPLKLNGELVMDFVPRASDECDLCANRRAEGNRPFCAEICPTKALSLQTEEQILRVFRKSNRFHLCKILEERVEKELSCMK